MITHKEYAVEFAKWLNENCIYLGFSRYYYDDKVDCVCSGSSMSLGLQSKKHEDTELARVQILNYKK